MWIEGSAFRKPPSFSSKIAIHESLSRVLVFSVLLVFNVFTGVKAFFRERHAGLMAPDDW